MKEVIVTDDLRMALERIRLRLRDFSNDEERIGLTVRSDISSLQGDVEDLQFQMSGCDDTDGCPFDDHCGNTCKAARP